MLPALFALTCWSSISTKTVLFNRGEAAVEIAIPPRLSDIGCTAGCGDARVRRRCPTLCGTRAENLEVITSYGRSDAAGVRPSPHGLMAIMQSVIEELSQSIGGRRSDVPVAVHDACIAVGKALLESGLSMSGEATVGGLLGYPMAVIYSYLLNFKAFRDFVGASKALLMFPVAWKLMSSFADVVAVQGYASAEARAFYAANIYTFGEHSKPLTDPGWAQQFLGTIGTYTARLGRHCYRKVPTVSGAYNMSYAVHPLADEKLRIGILADWATGAPGSMRVLEELAKLKPDIVIHLGDTYYSGTLTEQRDFLHDPLRAHLGEQVPVYLIPGNHDYYASGGEGFFQIVDEFGAQEASFFSPWENVADHWC